jgi:hypothetical protein
MDEKALTTNPINFSCFHQKEVPMFSITNSPHPRGVRSAKRFALLLTVLSLLLICSRASWAQGGKIASNSLYLEILGNGAVYSLNYDRMFSNSMSGRIGIMNIPVDEATSGVDEDDAKVGLTTLPIMINYLKGGNHKLEIGGGVVVIIVSADIKEIGTIVGSGVVGTATFGYRYQPRAGGFNFRIGFTPIFGQGGFVPWGGLSLGYSF